MIDHYETRRGESHANNKHSESSIREFWNLRRRGFTIHESGRRVGLSKRYAEMVQRGRVWKWLKDELAAREIRKRSDPA